MKIVYSAQDPLFVGHLRNLLLQEGIPCEVRTPFLAAARGDIPLTECWSQLRVACGSIRSLEWGLLTTVAFPGGGKLGVYQPRHARPKPMPAAKVPGKSPRRGARRTAGRKRA